MKPSNFTDHPYESIVGKFESEIVAANIMLILKRTGDTWRPLSWDEYKEARKEDGNFSMKERKFFEEVSPFCTSAVQAQIFCPTWAST